MKKVFSTLILFLSLTVPFSAWTNGGSHKALSTEAFQARMKMKELREEAKKRNLIKVYRRAVKMAKRVREAELQLSTLPSLGNQYEESERETLTEQIDFLLGKIRSFQPFKYRVYAAAYERIIAIEYKDALYELDPNFDIRAPDEDKHATEESLYPRKGRRQRRR